MDKDDLTRDLIESHVNACAYCQTTVHQFANAMMLLENGKFRGKPVETLCIELSRNVGMHALETGRFSVESMANGK